MRIVIAGIPRAGKTTMADEIAPLADMPVIHTDDYMALGWSEASEEASKLFDDEGPWIIEGVMAVRALRKWMKRNPDAKPCDFFVWLDVPHVELNEGQARMAKGCETIFGKIRDDLEEAGTVIFEGGDLILITRTDFAIGGDG